MPASVSELNTGWARQASGNSFLPFRGLTFSTPNTSPHTASALKTSFPVCFEPENGGGGGVFFSFCLFKIYCSPQDQLPFYPRAPALLWCASSLRGQFISVTQESLCLALLCCFLSTTTTSLGSCGEPVLAGDMGQALGLVGTHPCSVSSVWELESSWKTVLHDAAEQGNAQCSLLLIIW